MKEKEFHGIIPPVVTPLTGEGELDTEGLERLLTHMLNGGVHGFFVLGTTGEGPALGRKEQEAMIRESCRIVQGRVPLLAGISCASAEESLFLAEIAKNEGCSAVVAAPPCYYHLGEPELFDFYQYLAGKVKMPLFIYNMPSMTKVDLPPSLVRKLSEIKGIRGYKDSSGNMIELHRIILELGGREDFSIFVGPEELLGEAVLFGADGGICGGANLNPSLFVEMYESARMGNGEKMRLLQKKIYSQRRLYTFGHYQSSMIKGLKCALQEKGICYDFPAIPFNHFEEKEAEKVAGILRELE